MGLCKFGITSLPNYILEPVHVHLNNLEPVHVHLNNHEPVHVHLSIHEPVHINLYNEPVHAFMSPYIIEATVWTESCACANGAI